MSASATRHAIIRARRFGLPAVPSLFRQVREDNERRPSTAIDQLPDRGRDLERVSWLLVAMPDNTQIYEGTNQIQRVVMARQLLK